MANVALLKWDEIGEKLFETGTQKGVLYPVVGAAYPKGVAWNGLISVNETPSGAETTSLYADDQKYLDMQSAEEFGATIEAYMYPDEFAECDGSAEVAPGVMIGQQDRKAFGFCYRTTLGNDTEGNGYGYKLHLIYGLKAQPSEKNYQTINDSPEAITFSWTVKATPVNVTGHKPTAIITLDSTKIGADKMAKIEEVLYGKEESSPSAGDAVDARLPLPDEVFSIIAAG